jgi:hypothetical protein
LPPGPVLVQRGGVTVEAIGSVRFEGFDSINASLHMASLPDYWAVRRNFVPGNLVPEDAALHFEALDGSFSAERAISTGLHTQYGSNVEFEARLDLSVSRVRVPASVDLSSIRHLRVLIRNGQLHGGWAWRGRSIGVRDFDAERRLQAICIEGVDNLTEADSESLWSLVCFLNGCDIQLICEESYDGKGRLLQQAHQRGVAPRNEPHPILLTRYDAPKIGVAQVSTIHAAFDEMHAAGFDIGRPAASR